jgi:hypothetical protein
MISLQLTNIKQSMAQLLLSDTFDSFLFLEGEIVTFNTFTIDGYLQKDFFPKDTPLETYARWSMLRDYCFSIIKGKTTPLSFRFIFGLCDEEIARFLEKYDLSFSKEQVKGLYLNFRYDGTTLHCVTGTSLNVFTMDKSLEQTWDKEVARFFETHQLPYELI